MRIARRLGQAFAILVAASSVWCPAIAASAGPPAAALVAPQGVTAISGQVMTAAGAALPNVILRDGRAATRTDAQGRFLLRYAPKGRSVMTIDGRHAGTGSPIDYGFYEVQVYAAPHVTTRLGFTSWLTPIDHAHAVTISSPTTREVVVRTPAMPGFELRIPPGTVITDPDGKRVNTISITPIPVARPPFPLPKDAPFPLYFTAQPGGAKLWTTSGAKALARVWYPNVEHAQPGARATFWHYDPTRVGWAPYGAGTVSADARHIIPDPGVGTYEFMGGGQPSDTTGYTPPAQMPLGGTGNASAAEPVDLATDLYTYTQTDLALADVIPISVTRSYLSSEQDYRDFGLGMSLAYEGYTAPTSHLPGQVYARMNVVLPTLGEIQYTNVNGSDFQRFANAIMVAQSTPGPMFYSQITWRGSGWNLTLRDGTTYGFNFKTPLLNIQDRFGNRVSLAWQQVSTPASGPVTAANYKIVQVASPNGRTIQFAYGLITGTGGGSDKQPQYGITSATDSDGRIVSYGYDACGRLISVTNPDGGVTRYGWQPAATSPTQCDNGSQTGPQSQPNYLTTITDPRGITILTNTYASSSSSQCLQGVPGRVVSQALAQTPTPYSFAPTCDGNGNITENDVTDPLGNVRKVIFAVSSGAAHTPGYPKTDTYAATSSIAQTFTYNRDPDTNLVQNIMDPLGRETSWTYGSLGNVHSVTQLTGTPNAVTTSFTYGSFSQVTTITDPLNHATVFHRNSLGEAASIVDANGNTTHFTYDPEGRVNTVTDALQNTTTYSYNFADLASITDPLSRTWSRYADLIGRTILFTDPLGAVTQTAYDPIHGISALTDANGNATGFTYDPDGNLATVTDPRSGLTQFQYDQRDRLDQRTDPLGHVATFGYDADSNLISTTDRDGQPSGYSYDPLNRLLTASYCTASTSPCATGNPALQSSVGYTWDAGNRLTEISDTAGGTVARQYDLLDRLTQETTTPPGTSTALGTLCYTYDAASRPASMTVEPPGQACPTSSFATVYAFDPGNRLTSIQQGGAAVACLLYDAANRREVLVLPDQVSESYSYDNASELTGLGYVQGGTLSASNCAAGTGASVGALSYGYDQAGQQNSRGGSLFTSVLPSQILGASYNADNQMTSLQLPSGTITPSYDANGSLTNDGTSAYTWDARHRLTAVGSLASFGYDAAGRRLSLAAGSSTVSYLYDRLNPVQEITAGAVSATLLNGLAIDERFSRTTGTTTLSFLADAQGSTAALATSAGAVEGSYAYQPFGQTTRSGPDNGNSYQYTGRENDKATGLYFYRARYYNPLWRRFISEDPIGLNGGVNLYAYVQNDPLNRTDPSGQCYPICTVLAGIAIAETSAYLSDPQHFTWHTAAVAGGLGLATGLVPIAAAGYGAEGLIAAAVNVGTNFLAGSMGAGAGQLANGQPVNVRQDLLLGTVSAAAPLLSGETFVVGVGTDLARATEAYLGVLLSANSQAAAAPLNYIINQFFGSAPQNTSGSSPTAGSMYINSATPSSSSPLSGAATGKCGL